MDLEAARSLANQLMLEHGLTKMGWKFRFNTRARRKFGECFHAQKQIELSTQITILNKEAEVRDVILHEIAHALAGGRHHHNFVWKAVARSVGARPERCYSSKEVVLPPGGWAATCPGCGDRRIRLRRPRLTTLYSCSACSGGQYDERFRLDYRKEA